MKTQVLAKKLLLPLIVIELAATAIGISSPAQATSLISFQGEVITTTNSKAILIAERNCRPKPYCDPGYMIVAPSHDLSPSLEPSRSQPYYQQHQLLPNAEPSPTVEPPPIEVPSPKVEQLPTAELSPQN